ncbi:hypothetical protein ACVWWG_000047 [Bradyrhizobium sp. LB7.2]
MKPPAAMHESGPGPVAKFGRLRPADQFLCAVQVPAHRDPSARPLQTPLPDAPDSLPDPDAYFCPTLTEARTAPDCATRPLKVRCSGG